jgi:hypothetical protein
MYTRQNFKILFLLLATFFFLSQVSVFAKGSDPQREYISHLIFHVIDDEATFEMRGASEFYVTPSSYSIHLNTERGRCAVHFLNFRELPGPGIYHMEQDDDLTVGIVCALEMMEPLERLSSFEGTFTIEDIDDKGLKGYVDVMLSGALTGKKIRMTGSFLSEKLPINLGF